MKQNERYIGHSYKEEYEYKIVRISQMREIEILNKEGRDGWILCAVSAGEMYFRRPLRCDKMCCKPSENFE